MKYFNLLILAILLFGCSKQVSVADDLEFETRDVATGLDTPWEILLGPDGHIWMTERYGRISRVNPETGEVIPLIVIDEVFENGERGLMGMALHPDFLNVPQVFTVYTIGTNNDDTEVKLVRFDYDGEKLLNPVTILDGIKGYWNHDGSRLAFDSEGKLYMTMGDRADGETAQDTSNYNGAILRMNIDGSVPADNPFENNLIWAYGSRNAQGLVFSDDGLLYSSEHGPDTDDEINLIQKGHNYGWPRIRGYCDTPAEIKECEENDYTEPLVSLTPQFTQAVAGLDYYNHDLFSSWNHSLLLVSLGGQNGRRLQAFKLNADGTEIIGRQDYFEGEYGRLRDLCISPDGRVFISTSNKDGRGTPGPKDDRIIEIKPKASSVDKDKGFNSIEIYPNPTDKSININSTYDLIKNIKIVDMLGNVVFEKNIAGQHRLNLPIKSSIAAGIYMAMIETNTDHYSKQFVIK